MLRIQTTANTKSKEPLSPKFSRLLREAWWIAALLLGAYIALILLTYNKGDASWSQSGSHATVLNRGGDVGAWMADLLLYLFGLSAWWIVGLALFGIWRSYHRIETTPLTDKRPLYISLGGFVVLLLASSGMETLGMYSLQVCRMAPGGVFRGAEHGPAERWLHWRNPGADRCLRHRPSYLPDSPGSVRAPAWLEQVTCFRSGKSSVGETAGRAMLPSSSGKKSSPKSGAG
jgi:hypothetical protein